jgi:hypothetical protein
LIRLYSHAANLSLAIEETSDGFFLYTFDRSTGFLGDIWHQSVADALAQAAHDAGSSEWSAVPAEVTDLGVFLKQDSN